MRLLALSAAFWFLFDQVSKAVVLHSAGLLDRGVIEVFPPFLVFRLGYNTGINFGILSGGPELTRWLLVAIALAVSAWLLWWARTGLSRPVALVSAGAVIGGALANALDRVLVGAVVDFLNMSCCGINNPYAFNVADIGIVVGALGLLVFADAPKNGS